MGGGGSKSGMSRSSSSGSSGAVATTRDGVPVSRQQAVDDMYDELTNNVYQPRAAEFAAHILIDGDNPVNYEMSTRYGYAHKNGVNDVNPSLMSAQKEGAQKWVNDHPEQVNRAIKNSDYNPTATKISMASPFSKSPDTAPAGTVLRKDDWRFTKGKSGSWSAYKGGKRQPTMTNADIKRVFS